MTQAVGESIAYARTLMTHGHAGLVEARRILEAELRANPDDYAPLDVEAQVLVKLGEAALATRLLEEFIRVYPEHTAASARLAWVMWETGRQDDALAEVRAALARHPESPDARKQLLEWQMEMKDWPAAQATAAAGLELAPEDGDYLLAVGRSAARLRNEIAARDAFAKLLDLNFRAENVARAYAEFLVDQNHTGEAARLLEPYLHNAAAEPATLMLAAEANFRAANHRHALDLCARVAQSPTADNDDVQHDLLEMMHRNIGLTGTDDFGFQMLAPPGCVDSFAVELLERVGQRGNRGAVIRIFQAIGAEPLRYPRAVARFLSTFHDQPLVPGTTARWVAANQAAIESNATLWGGVGAWHAARQKWSAAAAHLSRYEGRPGVRPWMLHLLGQALEKTGDQAGANRVFRQALSMAPDHSEPGVRSRLAFNLAMEDMASAGHLILMNASEQGKRLTTAEDLVRMVAVEALSAMARSGSTDERQHIVEQAFQEMRRLAAEDKMFNSKALLARFRNKCVEILSRESQET